MRITSPPKNSRMSPILVSPKTKLNKIIAKDIQQMKSQIKYEKISFNQFKQNMSTITSQNFGHKENKGLKMQLGKVNLDGSQSSNSVRNSMNYFSPLSTEQPFITGKNGVRKQFNQTFDGFISNKYPNHNKHILSPNNNRINVNINQHFSPFNKQGVRILSISPHKTIKPTTALNGQSGIVSPRTITTVHSPSKFYNQKSNQHIVSSSQNIQNKSPIKANFQNGNNNQRHSYNPSLMTYTATPYSQSGTQSPKKSYETIQGLNSEIFSPDGKHLNGIGQGTRLQGQNRQSSNDGFLKREHQQNSNLNRNSQQFIRQNNPISAKKSFHKHSKFASKNVQQLHKKSQIVSSNQNVPLQKRIQANELMNLLRKKLSQQGQIQNGEYISFANLFQRPAHNEHKFNEESQYNQNIRFSKKGEHFNQISTFNPLKRNFLGQAFPQIHKMTKCCTEQEKKINSKIQNFKQIEQNQPHKLTPQKISNHNSSSNINQSKINQHHSANIAINNRQYLNQNNFQQNCHHQSSQKSIENNQQYERTPQQYNTIINLLDDRNKSNINAVNGKSDKQISDGKSQQSLNLIKMDFQEQIMSQNSITSKNNEQKHQIQQKGQNKGFNSRNVSSPHNSRQKQSQYNYYEHNIQRNQIASPKITQTNLQNYQQEVSQELQIQQQHSIHNKLNNSFQYQMFYGQNPSKNNLTNQGEEEQQSPYKFKQFYDSDRKLGYNKRNNYSSEQTENKQENSRSQVESSAILRSQKFKKISNKAYL